MTRARKAQGRIAFVGSGPGDTGLLTVRANELLTRAELVVTDPDVPSSVLALVGADVELRPAVGDPGGRGQGPGDRGEGRPFGGAPGSR